MTHHEQRTPWGDALEALSENGFDGMAEAMRVLIDEAMKIERSDFLGADLHERTEQRRGYANGFKPKRVRTRVGEIDVQVPQVRDVEGGASFYPSSLERGQRSERALTLALAEMYVQGVSTRRVEQITKVLCNGLEISSTSVSCAAALLDEELERWRTRPLGSFKYLVLDARYEKVRHGGSVRDCALLIAIGVGHDGKRSVLGTSVSLSEAEVHWREFLSSLQDRGLHGVELITSDGHKGIAAALAARFTGVAWQRCQFHLQQAQSYVPRTKQRRDVAADLRAAFNATSRREAQEKLKAFVKKWGEPAPDLARWAEENIPQGFTVFDLGLNEAQRKRLRTTNSLENLNKQIRRRTRVAGLFPNEASLLRLASAVLMEISEEWETGRRYLPRDDA